MASCRNDEAAEVSGDNLSVDKAAAAPFSVTATQDGLIFTYFDDEGAHTVSKMDEVPKDYREYVRVDSLELDPHAFRDPNRVFITNLNTPDAQGKYPTMATDRAAIDKRIDELMGNIEASTTGSDLSATAESDVTIYMASWCGACKSTARFFRSRGVPFVEKDIEKDPEARAEMKRKARKAGVKTSGIPVIDFKGIIINGFDERKLSRLVDKAKASI